MRKPSPILIFICCFLTASYLRAQTPDTIAKLVLDSVVINAYGSGALRVTPAAINKIGTAQLQRYANTNILQAVNSTAGVSMEERSLGSYRLNIRGSSVRSPYGVRNVKVYYDNIPFTAPGGNTMLNMLGFYNVGALEIIKGPGSSLYGAGTGGVVLFEAPGINGSTNVEAGLNAGTYGTLAYHAKIQLPKHIFSYEDTRSDGYREHTQMNRKVASYQTHLNSITRGLLSLYFIYSDLAYQTPGALTLAEYRANAQQARPTVGANQGAVLAKAGIHQKATLLGLTHRYLFSSKLSNTTSLYGFYNETENPAIQNYELKKEPHWGGRTNFRYNIGNFSAHFGAELQSGNFSSRTFRNLQGNRGAQLTDDKLDLWQWMGFAQLNYQLNKWLFTLGASTNSLQLNFLRSSATPSTEARKKFNGEIQPRFAVLYKASEYFSTYANVSKGFSPPAANEIFADNNSYNLALAAENGWNIEPGLRWNLFNQRLFVDASYFNFWLSNAIVTRRDAAGANYYLNAGKTKQQGIETSIAYHLLPKNRPLLINLQASYTYHDFKYDEFVQLAQDFSGKKLPGAAPHRYTLMADIKCENGPSVFLSYSHSAKIALNDANSQFADSFQLFSLKLGYPKKINNLLFDFYAGTDNLFNQTYSLGNDMNGFGGRYYNVAPARSFYFGLKLGFVVK